MGEYSSSDPDSNNAEQTVSMGKLLAGEQLDAMLPKRGELREGTIARISPNEILVDIGAKSEGIIPENEVSKMRAETREQLQEGAPVTLYVLREASQDGPIVLSLQKAEEMEEWQQAVDKMKARSIHTGTILENNRGGVVVAVGHLHGFLPASLMSQERQRRNMDSQPAERWKDMIGEELTFKIKEVDPQENRIIISERAAEKEARAARRAELLINIEPGQTHSGRVVSLADFGAFVDIGGIDGLAHISQLSWTHVDHPSKVLEVGQEIDVRILSVDRERQRIGLSLKALQEDPWAAIADRYQEGQLVRAIITRLTKFGAFAALKDSDHIEGLVHISELADAGVAHPKEIVKENEEVTLRIKKIDANSHRLALSLKDVASPRFAELDYTFYVAAENDDEPEDLYDGSDMAAGENREVAHQLSEVAQSDGVKEPGEVIDAQKPTQIDSGETE